MLRIVLMLEENERSKRVKQVEIIACLVTNKSYVAC